MLLSPRTLDADHVLLDLPAERPEQVLEVVGRLAAARGPHPDQVVQRLIRRHRRGIAAIGESLVVPHAAVPALTRPMAIYLRTRTPLRWGTGARAADALALLVPMPGLVADTEWYWSVVHGLRAGVLLECLRSQSDPGAIHRLLTGVEQ